MGGVFPFTNPHLGTLRHAFGTQALKSLNITTGLLHSTYAHFNIHFEQREIKIVSTPTEINKKQFLSSV
jgi:hypothetical protein